MGFLAFVLLVGMIHFPLALLHGFVFTKLWAWFVIPTFSLPALELVPAAGIILMISFIRSDVSKNNETANWEDAITVLIKNSLVSAGFALIVLLLGHIWTCFL